jgi:hypothetical protein
LKKYGDCTRLKRVTPRLPLVGKISLPCCGVEIGSKREILSTSRFNSYQLPPYIAGEGLRETCLASSQEKLGQFQPSAQSSDEAELPQYIVHKLRIDSEEHKNDEVSQVMK